MAPSSSSSDWPEVPVFAKCVGSTRNEPCKLRPCSTYKDYKQGATRTTAFQVYARGNNRSDWVDACPTHVSTVKGIPGMIDRRSTIDDATNLNDCIGTNDDDSDIRDLSVEEERSMDTRTRRIFSDAIVILESFKKPQEAARAKQVRALTARSDLTPDEQRMLAKKLYSFAVESSITEDYRDKINIFTPDIETDSKFKREDIELDEKTWSDGFGYQRPRTRKVYTYKHMYESLARKIRKNADPGELESLIEKDSS